MYSDTPIEDFDPEVIPLVRAMNKVPGIRTIESCCGHGTRPFRIWFKADDLASLPELLYWFDGCHVEGGYDWRVEVKTDCAMSPATFSAVSDSRGEVAYEQADRIAAAIEEHVEGR